MYIMRVTPYIKEDRLSFLTAFYMYKRLLFSTHRPDDMYGEVANLSLFIFPLIPNIQFATMTYFIISYKKTVDSQLKTVLLSLIHVYFY